MARRSRTRVLVLWANGVKVGSWSTSARDAHTLSYDRDWANAQGGRPISLSLPFTVGNTPHRGPAVERWFDNLLPDHGPIRQRLASRYATPSQDAFDLLAAVGRDCVGAIQLLAPGETPESQDEIKGRRINVQDIEQLLLRTSGAILGRPDSEDEDLRVSIAGAQEKTALLLGDDGWMVPHGATPTTHILKLPLGQVGARQVDFSTSVDNEWLCLALLQAYGLDVARADILTFGSQRVLAVTRFDRLRAKSGRWLRLPQEDFCQALGVASTHKYEADGGPGLVSIARVLEDSTRSRNDLEALLAAQILFWALAAPDGHAKNFSLRIQPRGAYQLTPLYDVMSAWPIIGKGPDQFDYQKLRLAMKLTGKNRHDRLRDIQRRHFNQTARTIGLVAGAEHIIGPLLERTPSVIETVESRLPSGFNPQVAESIFAGLAGSMKKLATMKPD